MFLFSHPKLSLTYPADMAWTMDSNGNYYEKGVDYWMDQVLNSFKRQCNFYDIGSNFGYYSIKYHKYLNVGYAFEPVKSTFQFLSENIENNGLKNVKAFNFGLAEVPGIKLINIYNSSGCNTIFDRNIPQDHVVKKIGTEKIELEVLDKLIATKNLLSPDLIKIDVEGAELQVLQGARHTINTSHPIVIFEFSEATCNDAGYKRDELLDFFDADIYSFKGINSDEKSIELIPFEFFTSKNVGNVIAYPTNKEFLFK